MTNPNNLALREAEFLPYQTGSPDGKAVQRRSSKELPDGKTRKPRGRKR